MTITCIIKCIKQGLTNANTVVLAKTGLSVVIPDIFNPFAGEKKREPTILKNRGSRKKKPIIINRPLKAMEQQKWIKP